MLRFPGGVVETEGLEDQIIEAEVRPASSPVRGSCWLSYRREVWDLGKVWKGVATGAEAFARPLWPLCFGRDSCPSKAS